MPEEVHTMSSVCSSRCQQVWSYKKAALIQLETSAYLRMVCGDTEGSRVVHPFPLNLLKDDGVLLCCN